MMNTISSKIVLIFCVLQFRLILNESKINGKDYMYIALVNTANSYSQQECLGIKLQSICYEKAWDWPNKNQTFTVQN